MLMNKLSNSANFDLVRQMHFKYIHQPGNNLSSTGTLTILILASKNKCENLFKSGDIVGGRMRRENFKM